MKRIINIFSVCIFSISTIIAQPTQTIRGKIIDKDTKQPLIGANVIINSISPFKGTTSDANGNFILDNIPVGRHNILITYISYKDISISNLDINSGKEMILNIEMEESTVELNEIVVKAYQNKTRAINELSTISARTFSIEETGRYAGSRNDISRMAANYAGVSNSNDSRNDIVIRGNSPLGLLWRLEGLEIPNPNHFSTMGSNGGPISMLNYNVIANSDFMTGAFPSEYGNATSGVFDLKLRHGNNQVRENLFQFGALGTEFMLEGPVLKKSNGSYLVNYRFSTTSILTLLGIDFGYAGQANYQDLAYKIYLPTKNFGNFTLFGMGGYSVYKALAEDKNEDDFGDELDMYTDDVFKAGIKVSGISNLYRISDNSYIKTVIGITDATQTGINDSVNVENTSSKVRKFDLYTSETKVSLHSYINTKINSKHKIKNGIIIDNKSVNIDVRDFDNSLQQLMTQREGNENTWLIQAYSHWKYSPTDELSFNTGFHGQWLTLNNSFFIEPRFSVDWNFIGNQKINFGYGLHSKMQNLMVYYVATPTENGLKYTNKNLDFSKSHQFIIGYSTKVNSNTAFKAETYYQYLFDIPVHRFSSPSSFSMINEGTNFIITYEDSLVNEGTGNNYGIELTLERFFNKGFYYLFTTSIFNSKYKGSDGVKRNTAYNGNYVINMLAGKEIKIKDHNKFIIDFKVSTAGGRRYTPIDSEASKMAGELIEMDDEAFSQQHKNYFRTDLKVTYQINRINVTHEFFINIDNVFNNKNIFSQFYNSNSNQIDYIYQLGIFPTFQYKILF